MSVVPEDWGQWFAGFVDDEGCFRVVVVMSPPSARCEFQIKLRSDDVDILGEIQSVTGLGRIYFEAKSGGNAQNGNPSSLWRVAKKAECRELVYLFDRFPLRAKKRHDYVIWRKALVAWEKVSPKAPGPTRPGHDWREMRALSGLLRDGRVFENEAPHETLWVPDQLSLL